MTGPQGVPPVRAGRPVRGACAVFLSFSRDGKPDLDALASLVRRTHEAGLVPAVNMDTGFGPELAPAQRRDVLRATREALGPGVEFVAGAIPSGEAETPGEAYRRAVEAICAHDAVPIVFQSDHLTCGGPAEIAARFAEIVKPAPHALAFELGTMFAPFGRIYDDETFERLMAVEGLSGIKHSSLSRTAEWRRLLVRDVQRPGFRIYTGNDLAIDMVMYGSDYLLGLATFAPDAFAMRDRLWATGDARFFELNDALQAVGAVAFREPVPAYKSSAAVWLDVTGRLPGARIHDSCARRPDWEAELLTPLALRLDEVVQRSA